MQEVVHDAMPYDGYIIGEFEKLKRMGTLSGLQGQCTKLFTSLKLLQLKITHHWTDHGFKALLDLVRDMLSEGNEIPMTTYEPK